MNMNGLTKLVKFLAFLKARNVPFSLHHFRDEAITVSFALVGERYEVYFFEDHEEYSFFIGNEDVELNLEPLFKRIDEESR